MNSAIYRQGDSRWGSLPYPTYAYSFAGNGCGCCACTHVIIEQAKYAPGQQVATMLPSLIIKLRMVNIISILKTQVVVIMMGGFVLRQLLQARCLTFGL